jgi:protein-disulfide isomerase
MSEGNAGGNLRRFYIVFGVVALIGIGALGYSVFSQMLGRAAMEPVDLEGTEDMRRLTELATSVNLGSEDAPVTIIVFGDYLCDHCAAFSLRERPVVVSNLVDTGRARLVFYDFPLDPRPEAGRFLAARAARCAGDQGRFWDYHDRLYQTQRNWALESNKLGVFEGYAEDLALDSGEFKGCLNSSRHAEAVSANIALARALGLDGTPAVLVGTGQMNRRLPDYYHQTIQEAVDAILGSAATN